MQHTNWPYHGSTSDGVDADCGCYSDLGYQKMMYDHYLDDYPEEKAKQMSGGPVLRLSNGAGEIDPAYR